MTFPWARILLMLVIVGLCSIFLLNSRVLVLASMPFAASTSYSCSYNVDSLTDDRICEQPISSTPIDITLASVKSVDSSKDTLVNSPVDSNQLTALTNTLIDVNSTLLGYVGEPSSTNPLSEKSVSERSVSENSSSNDIHFVPTYSARYLSIVQYQSDESKPNYLLAYEFVSPPVPSLTIGYQINFSPQLDWVLSTASAPSRLSAWKESNLLFVHAHTC
ncbi:hypothetical protein H5125_03895 [Shewanella sp. SR44-4]|jgi:hypothetical protein|uniref:hypothetical protein n=1 Tax=Shewanella sp. SR44-4 TaxID=2760935 RepID=UPI001603B8E9|nr:hypothetical protein [Shewanella sp. SR44-4]MBB1361303.1 hypothetical protein [Shewanella sp. SR44-4]